jgi:hypothetical protein
MSIQSVAGSVPSRVIEIQARFGIPPGSSTTAAVDGGFATALLAADGVASAGGSGGGQSIVDEAKHYLGVPYVWGGNDPAVGLDCSGFVKLVASKFGIELPRVAADQARMGRPVASLAEARPGDLLAFGSPVGHIGIYIGNGKMIDASRRLNSIVVRDVYETPTAIRRITTDAQTSSVAGAAGTSTLSGATPYADLFAQSGARHGVDPKLLAAVAQVESGFNPLAGSGAGAQGLMQFMPSTAKSLGVNPWDPASAIDGAARLLADSTRRYGSVPLALAAYNAGPGAVQRYGGIPPYAETQAYVRKVMALVGGSGA